MEIRASYSSLVTHRSCPQQYYYGRVLNLSKPAVPGERVELEFGSWWHALRAIDAIERGRAAGTLRKAPTTIQPVDAAGPEIPTESATPETVIEQAGAYWESMDPEHREEWIKRLGEPLPQRLAALERRWGDQWAEEREEERPIAVEAFWERKLPMEDGTDATLIGFVDEVYLDTRRNLVVVRDHKTGKQLATQTTLDDMMDSQLQLYAWGMAPQMKEWGYTIQATAYDRVRSVAATTPRLNKGGTLSKQVTQFDLMSYLEWVAEGQFYPGTAADGSRAGQYEVDPAMVEHLSQPSWISLWFQRTLTPLNSHLIKTHLRAAADTVTDVIATRQRAERDGFAARNLTSSCRWCDFSKLCRAQMVGGPDGYYEMSDYGLVER